MPQLSVVIPTLGRPGTLARTLDRLVLQRDPPDFEVIVVADAAEGDVERVRAVAGSHCVLQAPQPGVSAARNEGLRAARAPLILFLGDDILAEPSLLAAHAGAHTLEPAAEVAVQGHVRWADEITRTPFMDFIDEGRWQFDFPGDDERDAGWGRLYACNLSIKRAFLEAAGGFDESFRWGYEELELARRLRDRGLVLRWAPKARAEHLHEPDPAEWADRLRRVAQAERQMVERHPDVEPFFARRAEQIAATPAGHGRGERLVRLLPHNARIRASAFGVYERRLAAAFLSAWRAPAVDPGVYDEAYYRSTCAGGEVWQRSEGGELDPLYAGSLERACLEPGEVVVDVGTGRGELLVAALARGAARAIGIEYSPDAAALARHTLDVHGAVDRAEVLLADARVLPLPGGQADLVTMLDVVEHLTAAELGAALAEARRVLRPGGRILIHTLPSRTLYEVTYRLQRALTPRRRRTWPRNPRNAFELEMHVGEQTVRSLRAALREAGFDGVSVAPGLWIHDAFVPDRRPRRLYRRLAAFPLTRRLGAADLWAAGHRPADRSAR